MNENDVTYKNPFYLFKFTAMLISSYSAKALESLLPCRRRIRSKYDFKKQDPPQFLSSSPLAADSVFFTGASGDEVYFSVGISRERAFVTNTFMFIKLGQIDSDTLILPQMPDTVLKQNQMEMNTFSVDGLTLTNIVPLYQWKIEYEGIMKGYNNPNSLYAVRLDVMWTAYTDDFYIYEREIPPYEKAESTARQKWNGQYFRLLRMLKSTCFAQVGYIEGIIEVNGATFSMDNIQLVKDRFSSDVYDWTIFRRFTFHTIVLANGDILRLGMISAPNILDDLPVGFIYRKPFNKIFPITSLNMTFRHVGDKGVPPADYAFTFEAEYSKFDVSVSVEDIFEMYVGSSWECKILKKFCQYEVRGVPGWGISQWLYRNKLGRSACTEIPCFDPRNLAELYDSPEEAPCYLHVNDDQCTLCGSCPKNKNHC